MTHEQAQAQVASIVDLVAALDADFERLDELRDAGEQQRSVISGTHRPQDLIPAFIEELRAADEAAYEQITANGTGVPSYVYDDGDDDSDWWGSSDAVLLLEELFEALNDSCDDDIYFGAHCGDGSDFGFWLTEEAADELDELINAAGEYTSINDVEEAMHSGALSVEYRSGWTVPGRDMAPDEYRVVLCTGGPHVELRGTIGHDYVRVIWRDWSDSGEYHPTTEEQDALQQYVAVLGIQEFQF